MKKVTLVLITIITTLVIYSCSKIENKHDNSSCDSCNKRNECMKIDSTNLHVSDSTIHERIVKIKKDT